MDVDKLFLNATAVSDFKKTLRRKHTLRLCLVSAKSHQNIQPFSKGEVSQKSEIVNIHLPLMIFIRMHSQESQFHNKCFVFFDKVQHLCPNSSYRKLFKHKGKIRVTDNQNETGGVLGGFLKDTTESWLATTTKT